MLHARFAPSSAHRWIACTGSVQANEVYADPPSEAAMEGTAAHWLLEQCLVKGGEPIDYLGRKIVVRDGGVERKFAVTRDMARDVAVGTGFIRDVAKQPGWSGVEAKIDLSFLAPNTFGTTDLWHVGIGGVLTIADFKYGHVDVRAQGNEQLGLYASGTELHIKQTQVANSPRAGIGIRQFRLCVIQPRSVSPGPRVKEWLATPREIADLTARAHASVREEAAGATYVQGDHCRYCPALGECPATRDELTQLAHLLLSSEMTAIDAARILSRKPLLEKVVRRAEATALDLLLHNQEVPDFKLGTGTKHRQWRDEELAKQRLMDVAGMGGVDPKTPAQAEELGADAKAIVADLAFTPDGEPKVVPASSNLAPYVPKTAVQMFGAKQ